ncbi:MAG: hypothetical protein Q7K42_01535 [Candidatus Diapherotrites archaeon]|nr:hypothetical protein [Candidatus Diapherotrites archaeon]
MAKQKQFNFAILILVILTIILISGCTQPGKLCPPAGFPQPPGCGDNSVNTNTRTTNGGNSQQATPENSQNNPNTNSTLPQSEVKNAECFPSSCSTIKDPRIRGICENYRAGTPAAWPINCNEFGTNSCVKLCENQTIQHYLPSDVEIAGRDFYSNPKDINLTGTIYSFGPSLSVDLYWIKMPKARGAKVMSGISLWNEDQWKKIEDLPEEMKNAYVRGFDGEPLYKQDAVFLNILDPTWQAWAKKKIVEHIDAGTDGFTFDEHWATHAAMGSDGGPFDDYAISGFREYLKNKYTAEQLKEKSINNIDTFNYRDFLVQGNFRDLYIKDDRSKVPFMKDYSEYLFGASSNVISSLIDYAKNYASQKGKKLLFSANADPLYRFQEFPFYDKLDFYVFEHEWFATWRNSNDNRAFEAGTPVSSKLKYAQNRDQRSTAMYGIYDALVLNKKGIGGTTLLLHEFAESYANLGYYMFGDVVNYLGMTFKPERNLLSNYYGFIRLHPEAFNNLSSKSDVAVVNPPIILSQDTGGVEALQGFSNLLGENNIPHNVVDFSKIESYKIILIGGFVWSDSDVKKLLDYIRAGGIVITSDSRFASLDENGNSASRPDLKDLKTNGEHVLGNGKFIFFDDHVWWKIWAQRDSVANQKVLDALKTNGITAYKVPEKVQALQYISKDTNRLVIHVLNYDFNGLDFGKKSNVQITMDIPTGFSTNEKKMKLISPDSEEKTINFNQSGNTITFTIPSLYIWDIVIIE